MENSIYIEIIAAAVVVFLAMIVSVAIPPRYTRRILGTTAVVTVIMALGMYGYGHSYLLINGVENHTRLTSILRTVFDASRIFVGSNNWSAIRTAYDDLWKGWEVIFWTLNLLAMMTSASAVIVSLGSRLLKKVRIWIFRMRDITLIYGLNDHTLEFGRVLTEQEKTAVIYIDRTEQTKHHISVDQMGALLRCDTDALSANLRFLKSIGLKKGKRRLRVYALDQSMQANQQFARKLLTSLEARDILAEQTSLTILSVGEETDNPMQAGPGRYGYGSLLSVNEPDMVARILIREYPPCRSLAFDENGKALRDFHGIIIGFGQVGQAVLRQLVMNSQFQGSTSRIAVFAPDYEKRMGWISHECREMLNHYQIELYPYDGRSRQLYDYLEEQSSSINYVAICAGSDTVNLEIAERMQLYLERRDSCARILMCSSRGVSHLAVGEHIISHPIYVPKLLCSDQIDRMAMVLNQSYQQKGDMVENWKKCTYFDRMSSRAAADFYDALLYCAGTTREEALEFWSPQGKLLENLAATEHLRWNAFHYCMGFRPMTESEFRERADRYAVEIERDTDYRIAKDMDKRIHACMIPWEDLDAYSAKENAITGAARNYAENDRNNVRDLVKVLRAMK